MPAPPKVSPFLRLLRFARPFKLHIAGIFVLGLLAAPLALLQPLPLKIVVDSVVGSRPLSGFLQLAVPAPARQSRTALLILSAGLLISVALLSQLVSLTGSLLRTYTAQKMVLGFRALLFGHAQRLSLAYHDAKGTADAVYRIQYDTSAVEYVVMDGVLPFVTSVLTLLMMIWVTVRIDWVLVVVGLSVSPVLVLCSKYYRPRLKRGWRVVKNTESAALAVLQETLSALRVVKAFGQESREQERFVDRSTEGFQARLRVSVGEGGYNLVVGMTTAAGTAAVLFLGVRHVLAGTLSLGDLILVMAYLGQLYDPLHAIGKKAASMQGYLVSAERAFSILDHASDVVERPHARPLARATGAVSFREVSFCYQPGQLVLRNITTDIPTGSRVGLSGRTGAGKTTLVNLLTRFYDVTEGAILLDGVDLRDYRVADLRNQFAIVLQEPVLFSTSIAENIGYARPGASMDEIIAAAQAANAHDFILELPDGYDTLVGERGMRLSGGERQRVSLARAFLKDAPILILDEPTSSVDTRTETAIMEAMDRLMRGRTSFMIAHRLSTLRDCDLRLELADGRLVAAVGETPALEAAPGRRGNA